MYVKGCRSTWTAASIKENNSHPLPPSGCVPNPATLLWHFKLFLLRPWFVCTIYTVCVYLTYSMCVYYHLSFRFCLCALWSLSKYQGSESLSRLNVSTIDQHFQLINNKYMSMSPNLQVIVIYNSVSFTSCHAYTVAPKTIWTLKSHFYQSHCIT